MKIYIRDLAALEVFAQRLVGLLTLGDVLTLNGPMGAGKTTLTQALGRALGVQEKIASPTFTLIHDHVSGRFPLVHVDLYRLGSENAGSVADEVLSVVQEGRSLLVVEWADYGEFLSPYVTVRLDLAPTDDGGRAITLATAREEVLHAFAD